MDGQIRDALIEIHNTHEGLTPHSVVIEARSKKSPLHDCFEWDDSKAGHAYRLYQARALIRRVHIVVQKNDEEKRERVFYHTTGTDDKPVYHTKDLLIDDIGLLAEAKRQAIVKLNIAKNTVEHPSPVLLPKDKCYEHP